MTPDEQQEESPDMRPGEKKPPGGQEAGESGEVSCRCKEVSRRTLPEMLRLMISDLAFWKKEKVRK